MPLSPSFSSRKLLILALLISTCIAGAAAQESNSTSTIQVAPTLELVDHEWGQDEVILTFDAETPATISITDVNSIPSTGAGRVNYKTTSLPLGKSTVNMTAEQGRGGQAVTITSGENMVAVSSPSKPYILSVTATDIYLTPWVVGVLILIFVLALMGWKNYRIGTGLIRTG